jgi:Skp family chaperone for outer membrane proteins
MTAHLARTLSIAAGIALGGASLLLTHHLLSPPALAAQADADQPLIAVCATPTLINELMQSDRYLPARQDAAPELRQQLTELAEELQELQNTLRGADPQDPETQAGIAAYREKSSRAAQLQSQIANAIERKFAEQLVECFELVKSSADAIADDLGFDYVISTGAADEQLSREDSTATLRQITARPMIRFPKAADITEDVRDDLKLN